jgi:hypothetical protein
VGEINTSSIPRRNHSQHISGDARAARSGKTYQSTADISPYLNGMKRVYDAPPVRPSNPSDCF